MPTDCIDKIERRRPGSGNSNRVDALDILEAGLIRFYKESAEVFLRSPGDHDDEIGFPRVRDEHLLAVEAVIAGMLWIRFCLGLHATSVRTGIRLSQTPSEFDSPFD